jgi:hypothetical protein
MTGQAPRSPFFEDEDDDIDVDAEEEALRRAGHGGGGAVDEKKDEPSGEGA